MDTSKIDKEKSGWSDDFNMLPPISYLTQGFNRGLARLFNHFKITFSVFFVIYVIALIYVTQLALDVNSGDIFLVVASPFILPVVFFLAYCAIGSLLLAFFAQKPSIRIGFATGLQVLILFPAFLMAMGDTRVLLILMGEYVGAIFIILNLIFFPLFMIRYEKKILRYSYLCSPTLVLIILFIWFEATQSLSYTRIEKTQFSIEECERVYPTNKFGHRTGSSYTVCDVSLDYNGYQYGFQTMVKPRGKIEYMEIRQAIFQHFSLR